MKEQHSISSLSARLGVARATALGAIAAGRIKATSVQVGARQIYSIEQSEIEAYRSEFVEKLKDRVERMESDPRRAFEKTSSALASVRREVAAEADAHTPQKFITVREQANLLSIAPRHLHDLTRQNLIPCFRIGRSIRYNPQAVAAALERNATQKPKI